MAAAFLGALRCLRPRNLSASPSTTSSGWTRPRSRRSATRSRVSTMRRSRPCWRSGAACWTGFDAPYSRAVRTIDVVGLSVGATHEVLHSRLDATFPRPILSGSGRPPRQPLLRARARKRAPAQGRHARPRRGAPDSLRPRRPPARAPRRPRPSGARGRSRAAGALAEPTTSVVETAVGGSYETGLAETLAARILELDGDACASPIRSSDPRSRPASPRAADGHCTPGSPDRSTAEERARHLALATVGPNDEIAAILEQEAALARARGRAGDRRGARRAGGSLSRRSRTSTTCGVASSSCADRRRAAGDGRWRDRPPRAGTRRRLLPGPHAGGNRSSRLAGALARSRTTRVDAVDSIGEALAEAEGDAALEARDPPRPRRASATYEEPRPGARGAGRRGCVPCAGTTHFAARRWRASGFCHFRGGRGIRRAPAWRRHLRSSGPCRRTGRREQTDRSSRSSSSWSGRARARPWTCSKTGATLNARDDPRGGERALAAEHPVSGGRATGS